MKDRISLDEIWSLFKRNLIKIITCMFVGLGIAGVITFFVITPTYSSQTQLIAQLPKDQKENANDINTNLMMINTYKDLIKSNMVSSAAADVLKKDYHYDLSAGAVRSAVEVSQEENSQMFTIKATSTSPGEARDIANVVANEFQNKAAKVMKVDKVSITSKAVLNPTPVSPNYFVNLMIGLVAGFIVGLILMIISSFRDTTIKDEEWISNNLGITILGAIPEMNSKELSVRVKQVDPAAMAEESQEQPQEEQSNNEQRRQRRRV